MRILEGLGEESTHLLDVILELVNELTWEDIAPKCILSLSKADLQANVTGFEA